MTTKKDIWKNARLTTIDHQKVPQTFFLSYILEVLNMNMKYFYGSQWCLITIWLQECLQISFSSDQKIREWIIQDSLNYFILFCTLIITYNPCIKNTIMLLALLMVCLWQVSIKSIPLLYNVWDECWLNLEHPVEGSHSKQELSKVKLSPKSFYPSIWILHTITAYSPTAGRMLASLRTRTEKWRDCGREKESILWLLRAQRRLYGPVNIDVILVQ